MCSCGNKKCRVEELTAKTEALEAAAKANPSGHLASRLTRQERDCYNHMDRLTLARNECYQRTNILALGATCPLCARPVAPHGAEWSEDTCQIEGRLVWRGGWNGEHNGDNNRKECLGLAWERLGGCHA